MSNPIYPVSKNSVGKRIPVIPMISHETKQYFMEGSDCIEEVNVGGLLVDTAPLKPGVLVDLYALSNANYLINKGFIDVADTFSFESSIKYVYVSVGGSIMKFDLRDIQSGLAVPSLIGDTRGMNYQLFTNLLRIKKDSLDYLGQPFNYRHVLELFDTELVLQLSLDGRVENSRGKCTFGQGNVFVDDIVSPRISDDVSDQYVTPLLQAVVGTCEIVGFELDLAIEPRNDNVKDV